MVQLQPAKPAISSVAPAQPLQHALPAVETEPIRQHATAKQGTMTQESPHAQLATINAVHALPLLAVQRALELEHQHRTVLVPPGSLITDLFQPASLAFTHALPALLPQHASHALTTEHPFLFALAPQGISTTLPQHAKHAPTNACHAAPSLIVFSVEEIELDLLHAFALIPTLMTGLAESAPSVRSSVLLAHQPLPVRYALETE
jgi:hypothetical protein